MRLSTQRELRFRRLYEEHQDAMRTYCRRRLDPVEVEDAVADIFTVAWRRLDKIRAGGEELRWLYGVARNVVSNSQRATRRRHNLSVKVSRLGAENGSGPDSQVVRRVEDDYVLQALATLKSDDQELLRLRAWEELTRHDLAAIYGVTPEAIDMRLNRIYKRMARALRRSGYHNEFVTRPRAAEGGAS